jgi:hypothetical protein
MNKLCGFILCAISLPVAAGPVVEIKGGRYHLIVNGSRAPSYFSSEHKVKAAAVNKAFECNCVVEIEQPSLFVSIKYVQDKGVAFITWSKPTERESGDSLSAGEIQGYELTIESDDVTEVVNVGNVTTYTVNDLLPGSYTFTIRTVDKSGLKSAPSVEAYKVIEQL